MLKASSDERDGTLYPPDENRKYIRKIKIIKKSIRSFPIERVASGSGKGVEGGKGGMFVVFF